MGSETCGDHVRRPDDLADGGAQHFVDTITAIREASPQTTIEILTPDFLRKDGALDKVVSARPDVFNHNLETVPSNYLTVRPALAISIPFACCSGQGTRSDDVH